MKKFLKLLTILMLSAISWSCSSEEEFDEFDHPQYPIDHIWGFEIPLPNTGCEYVIRIPASGWIRYDSIAGSKVFLADQIFNIPVAKLNNLAQRPMLIPDSLTFMPVDTYKNTVYVEYADSVTINGRQYQYVNFLPASKANEALDDDTPNRLCIEPEQGDYVLPKLTPVSRSAQLPVTLNLFYHQVRIQGTANGTNNEYTTRSTTLTNSLNNYFKKYGIYFQLIGTDYIDNININDVKPEIPFFDLLWNSNPHNNAIDIYDVNVDLQVNGGYLAGRSKGFKSSALALFDIADAQTAVHELGHCLGLFHTHRWTDPNDSDKDRIPELVDGSNSTYAGDEIADTPADPNKWDYRGNYNGKDLTDANGDKYNPNRNLAMSYSFVGYDFSPMQTEIMHYNIRNAKELSSTISSKAFTVQGIQSTHFHATLPLTLKSDEPNFNVKWTVTRYSPSAIEDADPIISREVYQTASINLSSEKSDYIEVAIDYTSNNQTHSSELLAFTSNAPSPYTGGLIWESSGGSMGYTTNKDHGNSLTISGNNSVTLKLDYHDRLGAILKDLNYMVVTETHRVLTGKEMTITASDCSRGFLKFRLSDACGRSDEYFTLPVDIYGQYYAIEFDTDGGISFVTRQGKTTSSSLKTNMSSLTIGSISIYNKNGLKIRDDQYNHATKASISTKLWPKGTYKALIYDESEQPHEIVFEI